MKLRKNGWGTMQMLLLSGGLLLALMIAVFFISKLYSSFEGTIGNKRYMDLENKIENAAKEYVTEKNLEINGEYKISLVTLKLNGYIDELKDINGYGCNGYVKITNVDNTNHYKGYILCNDYQTANY